MWTYHFMYLLLGRALNLLLNMSPVQLDNEIKHLRALDISFNVMLQKITNSKKDFKKSKMLYSLITTNLIKQIDRVRLSINKFHCSKVFLDNTERNVDKAQIVMG